MAFRSKPLTSHLVQVQKTNSERAEVTASRKRFATLQAAAALRGITLHQSHDEAGRPRYIVNRWALTKELSDIEAVELFLAVQGVRA